MAAKDDIGKRILETRKQTEELKAQLQSLINTGRNIVDSGFHSGLAPSSDDVLKENVKISPNKVQIAKSFDINHSRRVKEPTTSKNPPVNKIESDQKESQKKLRNYNREEAREYIKKQREKRLEQTKNQNEEKLKAELKKKKLEELHKKSKELLTKNVQAKRERSKSRDRNIYLRPACNVDTKPINPNLLYPPPPDHVQRCRKNEIQKRMSEDKTQEGNKISKSEKKSEKENNSPSMSAKNLEHPNWKNLKPTNLFTSNNDEDAQLVDTQKSAKITVLSNITIRSPKESEVLESVRDKRTKDSTKPVVVEKNTIETQTNVLKKSCPTWLQDQPAQGYPYNFINTVKRQLQFVTNSPKPSLDIGIKNSLVDTKTPCKNPEQIRTKQELKDIIQGSGSKKFDLQSFVSHKCLNLDPKRIEHLELLTNKNNFDSIHSELHTVTTESESDTSKNIPEISSESGTSLKNNAESVKRNLSNMNPAINTERLNNMKLVKHNIKSATTTIRSDTEQAAAETSKTNSTGPKCSELSPMINRTKAKVNYSLSVNEEYESDFNTDLSRSRESIISANSPTYNKQVILLSPHYIPSNNSKSKSESRKTNCSELTTSISKELHSQNIPVAKSTPKEAIMEEVPAQSVKNSSTEHSTNIPNTLNESEESKISKSSPVFQSLATELHPSKSEDLSKSNSFPWVNTSRGSGRNHSEIEPLKKPSISLKTKEPSLNEDGDKSRNMLFKNISLRSNKSETMNSTNELHLKFEAEIHLLNDFNASLQQFTAVEKALETLKTNNVLTTSKILQNQDTQTSARPKQTASDVSEVASSDVASEVATINYSRGSFIDSVSDKDMTDILGGTILQPDNDSVLSTGLEMSTITKSKMSENEMNFENLQINNFAGMSLNMFEQLIKDEDARLDNLKAILKIREQVLLDRTKGELAWLEIQKKYFKETGQLHEASVIKKKQRGILVNLQKEKHEMQRMKQMQKAASVERKIVLNEKRNMIRQQLSTDNMLKIMKVNTPRERRQSGPLKVIQRHTESIRSETSISKRSSNDQEKGQEVRSVTSHHSSVSRLSEISGTELSLRDVPSDVESAHRLSHVKRTLLMRETALQKRKKIAEDLLQWHEKLLEEEKRITELESTANTIISQKPSASGFAADKYRFKGNQLNQLWYNLTGCEDKKFVKEKIYPMSQIALERFCKNARDYSTKLIKKTSDTDTKNSVSEDIPEIVETSSDKNDYPSDFDVESVLSHEEVEIVDQSISQLITNFSKIKEDISAISSKHSAEESFHFDKTDSDIEVSVIETNKDNLEKNKSSQLISSVNTEDNTSKDKSSLCKDDAQNHMQINIQNSVVENLNDSKEILLMLGHSEDQDVFTEDILSKLNRVVSDSDGKSCRIESHLSSSEKEELSREVRNSLSTTESILSKLSRVISEVQEKRSTEVSDKDVTEERNEDIQTAVVSQELSSEQARTSCLETENEEINTGAVTEDKEITEKASLEHIAVEEKSSEVAEDMIDLNTGEDSEELVRKLSSTHNIPSDEERGTEESSSKVSEDMIELNTGDNSEGLIEKLSSIHKVSSVEEESKFSEDPVDKSKLTNISSEKTSPEPTKLSIEERSAEVESKMSEDMLEDLNIAENSKELLLKLSSNHTIPSVEECTEDKSKISKDTKVSEDLADTSELTNISSEKLSSEHTNSSIGEKNSKMSEDMIEEVDNGGVSEELVQEQTIPPVEEMLEGKSKVSEDLTETSKLTNISSEKDIKFAITNTSSFQVTQIADESVVDSEEKRSSSLLEENERNFHNSAEVSERISSVMTNLPSSEDVENSGKIYDNSENLTVSPDDEDLDDTEKSSESLEQLLKISKSAEIEKLPFTDDSVSLNSSPEKLIEESPEKVSVQKKAPENHDGADPRIVEEKLTDELNSEVIEEDDTIPEISEELTDISENLQLDLSYGIIDKTKHSVSNKSEPHVSKEDDNSYEEKEHDSLSSSTTNTSSSEKLGLVEREDQDKSVNSSEKSPKSESVDVKKRVSEILADANQNSRGDKSPRMQDLYVTTYDLVSPTNSPEAGSPTNGRNFINSIFGSEAEEILRKQLAIEQEIKLITEQQQKENRPPRAYVREIPNKPPPPYTPPASLPPLSYPTIVPTVREIEEITQYSAKILHKAYATGNLDNISVSENTLGLIAKDVTKECYKFVFDLCKDAAREHYSSQFDADEIRPTWLAPRKKSRLAVTKPLDANGLEAFLNRRLKELFQYEKPDRRENTIIKWSRKKRDHVDEILVMESQAEEKEWTSYDKEELMVMDQITDEIFNLLLKDTAETLKVCFEVS